jgi:arginine decarboxylase
VKEAARVYSKIRQMGLDVEYLDIGGGMGVDYDGSKTTFEASINYTVEEFANTAVYTIAQVCDEERVPHPHIVTESGRVMTAYHAIFVASIRDEIETFADDAPPVDVTDDDPQVIHELKELYAHISVKNYREYYHDALDDKDQLHTQFNLGLISLEDRAKGEVLFWEVCSKAEKLSREDRVQEEEFSDLGKILSAKYLCNFSLFRSAPDSWAIKEVLELHPLDGKPYYLAIFLVGAYQEVMGSNHNLFGQPNEAHVVIDADGKFHVTRIVPGSRVGEMLTFAKYDLAQARDGFRRLLEARVAGGHITKEAAAQFAGRYEADVNRYTYLE